MPLVTISFQVTDANTNAPVSGANVYINDLSVGVTDSNGKLSTQVSQSYSASIWKITASSYNSTVENSLTPVDSQSVQAALIPIPTEDGIFFLQFTPPANGITWTLTGPITTNGVSENDGLSQTFNKIQTGNYTLTAALTGYQNFSQDIAITASIFQSMEEEGNRFPVSLIQLADPNSPQQGNTNGDSTPITTAPANTLSTATILSPVGSEYVYPSTEFDRYFTVVGVNIYIGNLFIDEVNSLQYALQDNAIPIYGYASRYVDAYGQGRSLVQGQLTINFVTEAYLYTVMKQYQQYVAVNNKPPSSLSGINSVDQVLGLIATRNSLQQLAANTSDPVAQSQSIAQAANAQTQINATTSSMTSDQITSLNTRLQAQQSTTTDVISFDNAIYQDVLFDIRITMGNEITGVQRTRYIEKCKLISNEQVIASDGMTLMDSYGFIGRRLR